VESQPSSRPGENSPYGMIGGIEETSASFEARSAPRSYPTTFAVSRRSFEAGFGTVAILTLESRALARQPASINLRPRGFDDWRPFRQLRLVPVLGFHARAGKRERDDNACESVKRHRLSPSGAGYEDRSQPSQAAAPSRCVVCCDRRVRHPAGLHFEISRAHGPSTRYLKAPNRPTCRDTSRSVRNVPRLGARAHPQGSGMTSCSLSADF
jgi:hypothetical protein